MLSASMPSSRAIAPAAARIRSRDRRGVGSPGRAVVYGVHRVSVGGRDTERALAWAALVAQPAFVAGWLIAGALEPRYDHLRQGVSELAARNAENPAIVMTAMGLLGLSLMALGGAVGLTLPRRRILAAT